MDTKSIEKFSIEARELLLSNMEQRLYAYALDDAGRSEFGVDADVVRGTVLSPVEKGQRAELFYRIEDGGTLPFVSEMAYTWFNRLAAIRYMELHGFLPSHVRMLSAADGSFDPECLHVAATLELPGLDRAEVVRLIQAGDDEPLYRAILIAQCNELAGFLPTVFGTVSADALTLPANLLHKSEFNVLHRLVTDIPEESWENVEILGWMYQFYNSEVKAEFFKSKRKAGADDLAPATQLFTPDWIARYMVDNSLGRLWMLNHPESSLKDRKADGLMEYYIEPDEEHEDFIRVTSPEDITFCDPACGSGHILVYAFQMLMAIYEECGYREREISELILTKNLSGFEIDPRAAQIATMALAFLAREHDRRFFGRGVTADITVLESVTFEEGELPEDSPLAQDKQLTETLAHFGEVGSLYQPTEKDLDAVQETLAAIGPNSLFGASASEKLDRALASMKALSRRSDVVVANPPYMGSSKLNPFMSKWVANNYPEVKSDLFSSFIMRIMDFALERGEIGMMTPYVWMFIGSYEKLRNRLIDDKTITSLAQLEYSGFAGATVPICTFTFHNAHVPGYKGGYVRLADFVGPSVQGPKTLEAIQNPNCGWFYRADATTFHDIPGSPIAYWASNGLHDAFKRGFSIANITDYTGSQNKTGDNATFLRFIWEPSSSSIGPDNEWCVYSKGGDFRRWYGNLEIVINWSEEARSFYKTNPTSNLLKERYWFTEGISYTMLTSGKSHFRYQPPVGVFDMAGPVICYAGDNLLWLLAFLNSSLTQQCLSMMNPTLNLQAKDVKALPIIKPHEQLKARVDELAGTCVDISRLEYNSQETSWEFKRHPLI